MYIDAFSRREVKWPIPSNVLKLQCRSSNIMREKSDATSRWWFGKVRSGKETVLDLEVIGETTFLDHALAIFVPIGNFSTYSVLLFQAPCEGGSSRIGPVIG